MAPKSSSKRVRLVTEAEKNAFLLLGSKLGFDKLAPDFESKLTDVLILAGYMRFSVNNASNRFMLTSDAQVDNILKDTFNITGEDRYETYSAGEEVLNKATLTYEGGDSTLRTILEQSARRLSPITSRNILLNSALPFALALVWDTPDRMSEWDVFRKGIPTEILLGNQGFTDEVIAELRREFDLGSEQFGPEGDLNNL